MLLVNFIRALIAVFFITALLVVTDHPMPDALLLFGMIVAVTLAQTSGDLAEMLVVKYFNQDEEDQGYDPYS